MTNPPKLLNKFRISEKNLEADPAIQEAYDTYSEKRFEFGQARKALNEASKNLHELLDGPLRSAGYMSQGKDWTLTEPEDELGLIIQVWSEPKRRGRRKPELPKWGAPFNAANSVWFRILDAAPHGVSAVGHSLPIHSAPVSNNVRFAPNATISHPGID
jgi:hypothetical protein